MRKYILLLLCMPFYLVSLSACLFLFGNYRAVERCRETRTGLIRTNIIGIAGEPGEEPYIEIIYSTADEERPGCNKTASIMVSPPYVFQNDKVYMTYEYVEWEDKNGPYECIKYLLRDFEEGGSEYLKIINHSIDKTIEFFIAGANKTPYSAEYAPLIPPVMYKNAPICFLLYPEEKPSINVSIDNSDQIVCFEGDQIGDLIVTEAWSIEAVAAMYRAEYAHSDTIQLTINYNGDRILNMVEGKISGWEHFIGGVFYGTIKPGQEMQGNETVWLLVTPSMFWETVGYKSLR